MTIKSTKETKRIVGITSCAAGVAHTYMAAKKLIEDGKKMGYHVRIETQGASGPEDILTSTEIDKADFVIIASDIDVEMNRFNGKKVYRTIIKHAVKDATKVINTAEKQAAEFSSGNSGANLNTGDKNLLSHIMNGISYIIPLLITAAIFLALPNFVGMISGKPAETVGDQGWDQWLEEGMSSGWWKFMYLMRGLGWSTLGLMLPVFAAFVAYSIGKKPAFIPGLIGGFLANPGGGYYGSRFTHFTDGLYPFANTTSGFWGALLIGLLAGYAMKYANQYIKVWPKIAAIKPMLLLPMIGAIVLTPFMLFVINPSFGFLNNELVKGLSKLGKGGKVGLTFIIAPMTATDLGGPINKAAYAIAEGLVADTGDTGWRIMRVVPVVTPSLGMGAAALTDKFIFRRRLFDKDIREAAPNAMLLSLLGISEGGLPFIFKRPLLTIPINMIGGTIGTLIPILAGTKQLFPDSAIWAWAFADPIWAYILGVFVGTATTMFMHLGLRYALSLRGKLEIHE